MSEEGLEAISRFAEEGIKTNCTLIFTANQGLLAAKAGASLLSPFVGRIDDINEDGMEVIRELVAIVEMHDIETEVLAASIRHPRHVTEAALAGAHIATLPMKVLQQMVHHPLTDKGIVTFRQDWEKARAAAARGHAGQVNRGLISRARPSRDRGTLSEADLKHATDALAKANATIRPSTDSTKCRHESNPRRQACNTARRTLRRADPRLCSPPGCKPALQEVIPDGLPPTVLLGAPPSLLVQRLHIQVRNDGLRVGHVWRVPAERRPRTNGRRRPPSPRRDARTWT